MDSKQLLDMNSHVDMSSYLKSRAKLGWIYAIFFLLHKDFCTRDLMQWDKDVWREKQKEFSKCLLSAFG